MTKGGGKLVLLGDDTWSRLMPGRWLRSHAMYSFHTWDLDTVDTGEGMIKFLCLLKIIFSTIITLIWAKIDTSIYTCIFSY